MKLRRNLAIAAAVVAAFACSRNDLTELNAPIVIDPAVTRASELSFDNGDRIGLTVIKNGEESPYISNAVLTCNGSLFTGSGVEWYADRSKNARLRAYYPYNAEGEPTTFTVRTDQRSEGYTLSDLMTSVRSDVTPTSGAVEMIFRHQLAKINIFIKNNSQAFVDEVGIISCAVTARVDPTTGTASAYASSQSAGIIAHETTPQEKYNAIIAPQRASLTFYVKLTDGSQMRSVAMSEAEYAGGRQFTARLTVTDDKLTVSLNGQIESWGNNTDLTPDNSDSNNGNNGQEEKPNVPPGGGDDNGDDDDDDDNTGNGSVSWGEVSYPTAVLADGNTWMTQNLRYIPDNKSVSDAPGDGSGVWYPCNNSKQPVKDESFIAEHGYIYSAAVAHGGSVSTGESAVQGICPKGWHLPTENEYNALITAYRNWEYLKESKFNLLFGGCINAANAYFFDEQMVMWGSKVDSSNKTYCFKIVPNQYDYLPQSAAFGASVRCVKDN